MGDTCSSKVTGSAEVQCKTPQESALLQLAVKHDTDTQKRSGERDVGADNGSVKEGASCLRGKFKVAGVFSILCRPQDEDGIKNQAKCLGHH